MDASVSFSRDLEVTEETEATEERTGEQSWISAVSIHRVDTAARRIFPGREEMPSPRRHRGQRTEDRANQGAILDFSVPSAFPSVISEAFLLCASVSLW
jgi:hypothetical protein